MRPSAVRARKALFDVIAHRLVVSWDGKNVLDGFAGSGTLGFEALLRGAANVVFIDSQEVAGAQIMENAARLGFEKSINILMRDMVKLGNKPSFLPPADIVFIDPPYYKNLEAVALDNLNKGGWLRNDSLIIVERAADNILVFENFKTITEHKVGSTIWSFLTQF